MSKINSAILEKAVKDIFAFSAGEKVTVNGEEKQGKVRNFLETIELQATLKSTSFFILTSLSVNLMKFNYM